MTSVYRANIITAASPDKLTLTEHGYVVVTDGLIEKICEQLPEKYSGLPVEDFGDNLLIPSFSDMHIHASQYTERGVGMDCLLFDWLNNYTFPQEAGFRDIEYARTIYPLVIRDLLRQGTMHAAFFTTIHYDACDLFHRMLQQSGMYAFTGKVNMDMNSVDYYCEDTQQSIMDTERYLCEHPGDNRVHTVLIPRFAPTCSLPLLKGLAKLGQRYRIGVHTHLVESMAEASWTKELFPDFLTDGDIYERLGFLDNGPSIFAHVIFPEERDLEVLRKHGCMAVHCPDSTANITAGIMPVTDLMEQNISISLGTDIGGGHTSAVYHTIAEAVQISKLKEFYEPDYRRIDFARAFYLATAAPGGMFGKVGQIREGYRFNTLVIENMEDKGVRHTPLELLERFCYSGDDRNILVRFLDGKKIDPDEIYRELLAMD